MRRVVALITILVTSLAAAAAKEQQQGKPFTIDDLAGDIMSDTKTRDAIMDVLLRTGVREHHRGRPL